MLLTMTVGFAKDIKTIVVTTTPQMHCESCENKIKGNLRFEKGVKKIETSIHDQTVTIEYDADKTSVDKLIEAFKKIGYEAEHVKDMIDLSKTPVLCNQIQMFKLKEVLPDGYVYYYGGDNTEIVLTRDKGKVNRYTSRFPQKPYMMSCDYEVKQLGETVTMIAYLAQYQEENPYYVLFAADSQEEYSSKWQQRVKGGINHCDWLFSVPIDDNFISEIGLDQLKQMLSLLEQSKQRDDLIKFNINQLNMLVNSFDEEGDCEAE